MMFDTKHMVLSAVGSTGREFKTVTHARENNYFGDFGCYYVMRSNIFLKLMQKSICELSRKLNLK